MKKRSYAGVGERSTPPDIGTILTLIARELARRDFTLRSGGAQGADTFFARGAKDKEIFYGNTRHATDHGYAAIPRGREHLLVTEGNLAKRAESILAQIMAPEHFTRVVAKSFVKNLHRRNIFQVLGPTLDDPIEFLVCYVQSNPIGGGTKTAVDLALRLQIPIYNIARQADLERLRDFVRAGCPARSLEEIARTRTALQTINEQTRPLLETREHADTLDIVAHDR